MVDSRWSTLLPSLSYLVSVPIPTLFPPPSSILPTPRTDPHQTPSFTTHFISTYIFPHRHSPHPISFPLKSNPSRSRRLFFTNFRKSCSPRTSSRSWSLRLQNGGVSSQNTPSWVVWVVYAGLDVRTVGYQLHTDWLG